MISSARSNNQGEAVCAPLEKRLMFPSRPGVESVQNWSQLVLVVGRQGQRMVGKVHWKTETLLRSIAVPDKYLFPNAPEWSPFKNLALPRLVMRQNTEWKWRENIWKKNTTFDRCNFVGRQSFLTPSRNSIVYKMARCLPSGFRPSAPTSSSDPNPNKRNRNNRNQEKTCPTNHNL